MAGQARFEIVLLQSMLKTNSNNTRSSITTIFPNAQTSSKTETEPALRKSPEVQLLLRDNNYVSNAPENWLNNWLFITIRAEV